MVNRLKNRVIFLACYFVAAIILFFPILNKNFVSDDFVVLRRVCLEGNIRVQGFFRPLSDCSIYLNYLIGGLNPFCFNLTNIFIHALNSFLLFELCLKWIWTSDESLQRRYAFIASILFLSYPFHNEAVVWLLGRGASIAAGFGIGGLLIFFSRWNNRVKVISVCACYFIGLLAYESVIVLPLILFVVLSKRQTLFRTYIIWAIIFLFTGLLYLLFRYNFSEAALGTYGEDLLKINWLKYPGNVFKVIGRLVIPPIKDPRLFLTMVVLLVLIISFLVFYKIKKQAYDKSFVLKLSTILGSALLVPFLFAVSTRTSESDRLLYFPSLFLCCIVSYFLCRWVSSKLVSRVVTGALCIYNIAFLELNNWNWYQAGSATNSILRLLSSDADSNKIYVVNLPNEINGAYVFREGFKDALIVNRIDTSRVVVINKLSKELVTNSDEPWVPMIDSSKIFIPPFVEIGKSLRADTVVAHSETIHYKLKAGSKLYYWDQHRFVLLNKHQGFF